MSRIKGLTFFNFDGFEQGGTKYNVVAVVNGAENHCSTS